MTNKLESALEQVGNVFLEMAREIKELKTEIEDLQILVHKHETLNDELGRVFKKYT